ncbi:Metallo-hydrolase/oxidoreductase [Glarea lozoyensis ATCC 20868]|uniref:Metallo-hydrolase/oxidoreductase n=1 Tax=Glarea lozoyensis (strain ATCC 20868 / MF5171) TaxID=1116229 RepID=S3DCW0_GLAL2|nr:Metallo-hydrolase/oxidoreductase [Glarea lozoyensis ATCC 20868]EPE24533.1 Metallo-hydrolase/oxidoreductase [Glarea lozoyensis ATCC 20868]
MARSLPKTSFISKRINPSTFLIIEDDSYGEQPYIYVKLYPNHIFVTDTGCNSPRSSKPSLTSLREYIETIPLPDYDNKPLNSPGPTQKQYVIICTHCHYDHILGIPQFLSATPPPLIIASKAGQNFITHNLPSHSLCKYIPIPTPKYTVTNWVDYLSTLSIPGLIQPFRVIFLHTPGHTPDSLSYYDIDTQTLYTGDLFYTRHPTPPTPSIAVPPATGAIIFPVDGNFITYMSTLDLLLSFIRHRNRILKSQAELTPPPVLRVKSCCSHLTYNVDAETIVEGVKGLFERIIRGEVPSSGKEVRRGVVMELWVEEGGVFSVLAPSKLVDEAREHFK